MRNDAPLLELQRIDSEADALRAQRAGLPERAALLACEAEIEALARERDAADLRRLALGREERRVEGMVADLAARAGEVERTLYSGTVSAVRELEALHADLLDTRRRRGACEDEELALMAQEEHVGDEIAALDARRAALAARAAELRAAIGAAEARIDSMLEAIGAQRDAVAPRLSAELLAAYGALRALPRLGGRVAARLEGGACTGCRVVLPIVLASRIEREPTDVPLACPSCGRLLVR